MGRPVMVMTAGVSQAPEPDTSIIWSALQYMARNREPEPSLLVLTPDVPARLTPEKRGELVLKQNLLEDGGRTLLSYQPMITRAYWLKKDDWRHAERQDKLDWGVPADTDYIITAMLPEEY